MRDDAGKSSQVSDDVASTVDSPAVEPQPRPQLHEVYRLEDDAGNVAFIGNQISALRWCLGKRLKRFTLNSYVE